MRGFDVGIGILRTFVPGGLKFRSATWILKFPISLICQCLQKLLGVTNIKMIQLATPTAYKQLVYETNLLLTLLTATKIARTYNTLNNHECSHQKCQG